MNQRHTDTALSVYYREQWGKVSDKTKSFASLVAGFSIAIFMLMPVLLSLYQSGSHVG